jgi:hypothetical protein
MPSALWREAATMTTTDNNRGAMIVADLLKDIYSLMRGEMTNLSSRHQPYQGAHPTLLVGPARSFARRPDDPRAA